MLFHFCEQVRVQSDGGWGGWMSQHTQDCYIEDFVFCAKPKVSVDLIYLMSLSWPVYLTNLIWPQIWSFSKSN